MKHRYIVNDSDAPVTVIATVADTMQFWDAERQIHTLASTFRFGKKRQYRAADLGKTGGFWHRLRTLNPDNVGMLPHAFFTGVFEIVSDEVGDRYALDFMKSDKGWNLMNEIAAGPLDRWQCVDTLKDTVLLFLPLEYPPL